MVLMMANGADGIACRGFGGRPALRANSGRGFGRIAAGASERLAPGLQGMASPRFEGYPRLGWPAGRAKWRRANASDSARSATLASLVGARVVFTSTTTAPW
jgi:hypothetical protein